MRFIAFMRHLSVCIALLLVGAYTVSGERKPSTQPEEFELLYENIPLDDGSGWIHGVSVSLVGPEVKTGLDKETSLNKTCLRDFTKMVITENSAYSLNAEKGHSMIRRQIMEATRGCVPKLRVEHVFIDKVDTKSFN
jgi:hypothetical protein